MMNPWIGAAITEKLSKSNHAMWKAQILAVVRALHLEGHLTSASPAPAAEVDGKDSTGKDAKVPNPLYEEWFARDQQVLILVLGSLARDVLAQVAAQDTTTNLWSAIEEMYSSQNRAKAVNTQLALATAQKGNQSIADYVDKMRTLGDEMAAAGRKLEQEELVEYILTGLGIDFNPIISALLTRKESITVSEVIPNSLLLKLAWSFGATMSPVHRQILLTGEDATTATAVAVVQVMAATMEDRVAATATTSPTTEEVVVVVTAAATSAVVGVGLLAPRARAARSATKSATQMNAAGIDLKKTMSLKRSMLQRL
jgi:hypothetical protein